MALSLDQIASLMSARACPACRIVGNVGEWEKGAIYDGHRACNDERIGHRHGPHYCGYMPGIRRETMTLRCGYCGYLMQFTDPRGLPEPEKIESRFLDSNLTKILEDAAKGFAEKMKPDALA